MDLNAECSKHQTEIPSAKNEKRLSIPRAKFQTKTGNHNWGVVIKSEGEGEGAGFVI